MALAQLRPRARRRAGSASATTPSPGGGRTSRRPPGRRVSRNISTRWAVSTMSCRFAGNRRRPARVLAGARTAGPRRRCRCIPWPVNHDGAARRRPPRRPRRAARHRPLRGNLRAAQEPSRLARRRRMVWARGGFRTGADRPDHGAMGRAGHRTASTHLQAAGGPVRWLRHVDDGTLRRAYEECAFTVFPSLVEGFGLPIAGKPLARPAVRLRQQRRARRARRGRRLPGRGPDRPGGVGGGHRGAAHRPGTLPPPVRRGRRTHVPDLGNAGRLALPVLVSPASARTTAR